MDEEKEYGGALTIYCGKHRRESRSAVVCRHLRSETGDVRGFVENSDDPDDRQAWCGSCEALFLEEDDLTERFRAFCDMGLVCEFCYEEIKHQHADHES